MIREYLGASTDVFGVIGALATSIFGIKVGFALLRFLRCFVLSKPLGLAANLKKAGTWAVITGCTDGIGKAYAEQLAARGLNVVLISRTLSKLEDLAKEIEEKYKVKTVVIAVDFSREDIYNEIRIKLKGLDVGVLVNNVGGSYDHPEFFGELEDPDIVDRMIHMNCTSVARMTQIVLPEMVKKRAGYVINIGSASGTAPTPLLGLYSGTKAFVDLFTRSLDAEYSNMGITFQLVTPYFVASKMSKIRRPTMSAPSPTTFVKSALNTVGLEGNTTGYWNHEFQDAITAYVPMSVKKMFMLKTRAVALKKKAAAKSQ